MGWPEVVPWGCSMSHGGAEQFRVCPVGMPKSVSKRLHDSQSTEVEGWTDRGWEEKSVFIRDLSPTWSV
jgi:hypothetical protein